MSLRVEGGWQMFCDDWGVGDCAGYYADQLAWYDGIMNHDNYVIGSTVFETGLSGWKTYEIYPDVMDAMRAYCESKQ